ncbi:hypothetical protein, partial [Thermomonas sp.]|uniref:hypothetical protein n=1 Tax=Thermomonas sp. TaxID=1971895 RepID=UPI002CA8B4D1
TESAKSRSWFDRLTTNGIFCAGLLAHHGRNQPNPVHGSTGSPRTGFWAGLLVRHERDSGFIAGGLSGLVLGEFLGSSCRELSDQMQKGTDNTPEDNR